MSLHDLRGRKTHVRILGVQRYVRSGKWSRPRTVDRLGLETQVRIAFDSFAGEPANLDLVVQARAASGPS